MIQRCENFQNAGYAKYGAAGVKVCDHWHQFENFLADMGERPLGTTLGRYLDLGNYDPTNCEWQTKKQQVAECRGKRAMFAYRKARQNGFVWKENSAAIAA
jgi:hypothetical protein